MEPEPSSSVAALSVRGLGVSFRTHHGWLRVLHDVSFDVAKGASVGLVGESGCGKSVTSLSVLGLLPRGQAVIDAGQVLLHGRNLVELSERDLCRVRGRQVAMIFQEPMTSLNPVYTVGWQLVEAVRLHLRLSRKQAHERGVELLRQVRIPDPGARMGAYPHELSGGTRQRVMIAMALACNPDVLIADEPTTALDVTIQAQILELLRDLQTSLGMAVVLVTHDLGVVAQFVDNVVVMYAGRVVEQCSTAELFASPAHPYTQGLLRSLPARSLQPAASTEVRHRLPTIEGTVPSPSDPPPGCRFAPRCAYRQSECDREEPGLRPLTSHHSARCIRAGHLDTPAL